MELKRNIFTYFWANFSDIYVHSLKGLLGFICRRRLEGGYTHDLHTRSEETNVCQLRPERPNAKEVAFGAWYLLACFSDPTLRMHGSVLLARYLLNLLHAFFYKNGEFPP